MTTYLPSTPLALSLVCLFFSIHNTDEQGNNERPYKHELIHTLCDRSTPKIIHDYVVKHFDPDFPELTEESINDPEVTKKLHPYLLEREIIFGKLVCPHCGREFPIKERIAHMLLNEDEV